MAKLFILLCLTSLTLSSPISLRNSTTQYPNISTSPTSVSSLTSQAASVQSKSTLCEVKVFRKLRLPWMGAFGACKGLGDGSELVSIKSNEDYKLLASALTDIDTPTSIVFWTSGVDLVEEGVFTWMSDGSGVNEIDLKFWSNGQPDNLWDSEHCLGLRRRSFDKDYKLADENCYLAGAFICAKRCG